MVEFSYTLIKPMEELNKKVIWNAISAYFLVFVSIFFLFSKQKYVNHPFVKNHVKSAFILHIMLLLMLYIMSYSFLDSVQIFNYSLNTLITITLSLGIFWAMLYGVLEAHRGKTTSLWEIIHTAWISHKMIQSTNTEKMKEEENFLLILAHVPFFGYIIYPRHKNLEHIRDISQLNLFATVVSILLLTAGYSSLGSIVMLLYIIWSVLQSLMLVFQSELITLNLSKFPVAEEKYILQIATIKYVGNTLKKEAFIPFQKIKDILTTQRRNREKSDIEVLKKLKKSSLPSFLYYIPIVNLIWIFFTKTYDRFHIKNGITITLIFTILCILFWWDSPVLLFVLFPVCYGIGYIERKAYRMPYIYDMYSFIAWILYFITHIFYKTRSLQKTQKVETITIWETQKKEEA